jgi:hypothetical protein
MTQTGPLLNAIDNLQLKNSGWLIEGVITGEDIIQQIKGLVPGRGWDEKPQFTYRITIDDFTWKPEKTSYTTWDTNYIFNEFYKTTPEESPTANITFTMYKKIPVKKIFRTELIEQESDSFTITYNFRTGRWNGDDSFNDTDGYGHIDGIDFEIWFTIRQTDYDADGIPYWTEVNILNTNPKQDDSKLDPDNDGIPTSWEWKWGYNHTKPDNHSTLDPDHDGLQNIEEYTMAKWLANPYYPDIYIETDYSDQAPFKPFIIERRPGRILPIQRSQLTKTNLWGQKHEFWEESQQMLMERFNQHGITVHIDDGCMGEGGEILDFLSSSGSDTPTVPHVISQLYNINFPDERKGIFRYLIVAHTGGWAYNLDYTGRYDTMVVGQTVGFYKRQSDNAITPRAQRVAQAVSIMHELGHTCGFGYIHSGGVDNISKAAWIKWYDYKSCMNYLWYRHRFLDYSDGSNGNDDTNDWATIRLDYFQLSADDLELEGIEFDATEPPYNRGDRG